MTSFKECARRSGKRLGDVVFQEWRARFPFRRDESNLRAETTMHGITGEGATRTRSDESTHPGRAVPKRRTAKSEGLFGGMKASFDLALARVARPLPRHPFRVSEPTTGSISTEAAPPSGRGGTARQGGGGHVFLTTQYMEEAGRDLRTGP